MTTMAITSADAKIDAWKSFPFARSNSNDEQGARYTSQLGSKRIRIFFYDFAVPPEYFWIYQQPLDPCYREIKMAPLTKKAPHCKLNLKLK